MTFLGRFIILRNKFLLRMISTMFCVFLTIPLFAQPNTENQQSNVQAETILLLEGGIKVMQGDLQGALTDYLKVIEINPDNIEAYLQVGYVKKLQGHAEEANEQFAKGEVLIAQGLDKDPNNARMYYLRSRAKRYTKDYDGAIADIKKAVELDPQRTNYPVELRAIEVERDFDSEIDSINKPR